MCELVFSAFKQLRSALPENILTIGEIVPIPEFTSKTLHELICEVYSKMEKDKAVVHLSPGLVVVGDIHGNLIDLFRIMNTNGYPPMTKYLFLGDYVDRGEYSVEVIAFLLSLMTLFPLHVTLLRGNHEFSSVNATYGFKDEIMSTYNDEDLWNEFNTVFNYLPIAAVIGDNIFAVHGGLSEHCKYIREIESLKLPIKEDKGIVGDLVWSDPNKDVFGFSDSLRGKGCLFGSLVVDDFCKDNKIRMIIRGHQCVYHGYEYLFRKRFLTVFSTSSYSYDFPNMAAYAVIDKESKVRTHELDIIPLRSKKKSFRFSVIPMSTNIEPHTCICLKSVHSLDQIHLVKSNRRLNVFSMAKGIRKSSTCERFVIPHIKEKSQ